MAVREVWESFAITLLRLNLLLACPNFPSIELRILSSSWACFFFSLLILAGGLPNGTPLIHLMLFSMILLALPFLRRIWKNISDSNSAQGIKSAMITHRLSDDNFPSNGRSKFDGGIWVDSSFRYIVSNNTLCRSCPQWCKYFGLFYLQVLHLNILLESDNLDPVTFSLFFSKP